MGDKDNCLFFFSGLQMEVKRETKSDAEKIKDICQKTGLSEFSLTVYAAMISKTHPIRISGLFRVVCPNREGIRSLSPEKIQAFERDHATIIDDDDTTKKSKKSSDDWRRCIIKEREKELTMKIGGTVDSKKKMPPRLKELQLIWEYLGWGQTKDNFYVYVYYIGPEDKGEDMIELTRTENWHIVPESHLVLFHKHMGDAHNYFQQSPLSVKESTGSANHIEYDVRYILFKWKGGQKAVRKEQIELVKANIALFERKDTMRVKYDRKRGLEIDEAENKETGENEKKKRKKSKKDKTKKDKKHKKEKTEPIIIATPKVYEVKNEKYRKVVVDEYLDITRYPLCAHNGITFDIHSIDTIVKNALADPSRKPASYKWDPTEKIVKPFMIASSMIRLRKQIVQTILKKYNLCFESNDFDAIHYFITHNKEAADDIKRHFDMFTWSYSVFNVLTMRGFIPDAIDDMLTIDQ